MNAEGFTSWLREYWQAELEAADLTRRSAGEADLASRAGQRVYRTAKANLAAAEAHAEGKARSKRRRHALARRREERDSLGLRVQAALELENTGGRDELTRPGGVAARVASIRDRADHAQQRAWVRYTHHLQHQGRGARER